MIKVRELTKRYGPVTAVDKLTFDVLPGRVTGFLGPNGAGKSLMSVPFAFALCAAYVLAALMAAFFLIRRRDV